MDRQLFILDDRVWDSMSFDDVKNTMNDMSELDIAYPPCRYFDILTKAKVVHQIVEQTADIKTPEDKTHNYPMKWRYDFDEKLWDYKAEMFGQFKKNGEWVLFSEDNSKHLNDEDYQDSVEWTKEISSWVLAFLLVSLATKNSIKTIKENKLMKLGIGKKKDGKYRYTTTVTIGEITETEGTGEGGGWTVRPHLRRGHIREQRYGPNRQHSKKVFIQPVFVNASEDFINERKAYNVRLAS